MVVALLKPKPYSTELKVPISGQKMREVAGSNTIYIKGKTYAKLAKDGDNAAFDTALTALQKVSDIEEKSGKNKYSDDAQQSLQAMSADLVNSAVEDNGNKKFKEAAEKLYTSYKISPKDTSVLVLRSQQCGKWWSL